MKGLVYLKPVSRTKLIPALKYSNVNNLLYHDLIIGLSEITNQLLILAEDPTDCTIDSSETVWQIPDYNETSNPLDKYR